MKNGRNCKIDEKHDERLYFSDPTVGGDGLPAVFQTQRRRVSVRHPANTKSVCNFQGVATGQYGCMIRLYFEG